MRKEVVVYTQLHSHIGDDRTFVGLRPEAAVLLDLGFPHKIPAMLIAAAVAEEEKCGITIREERWDQYNEPHQYVLIPDSTHQMTAEAARKWVSEQVRERAENISEQWWEDKEI